MLLTSLPDSTSPLRGDNISDSLIKPSVLSCSGVLSNVLEIINETLAGEVSKSWTSSRDCNGFSVTSSTAGSLSVGISLSSTCCGTWTSSEFVLTSFDALPVMVDTSSIFIESSSVTLS